MYNNVRRFYPYIYIHIYEESKYVLLYLQENVCVCSLFVWFFNPKFYSQNTSV